MLFNQSPNSDTTCPNQRLRKDLFCRSSWMYPIVLLLSIEPFPRIFKGENECPKHTNQGDMNLQLEFIYGVWYV